MSHKRTYVVYFLLSKPIFENDDIIILKYWKSTWLMPLARANETHYQQRRFTKHA